MGLAASEAELQDRASRFLKAELKRAVVTYADLADRLKHHGYPSEVGEHNQGQAETRNLRGDFPISGACGFELEGLMARGFVIAPFQMRILRRRADYRSPYCAHADCARSSATNFVALKSANRSATKTSNRSRQSWNPRPAVHHKTASRRAIRCRKTARVMKSA